MSKTQWLALCLLLVVLVAAIGQVDAKKKKKRKQLSPEEVQELQDTHFNLLASATGLKEQYGRSEQPVLTMEQMFSNVAEAYEEQLQANTAAGARLRSAPRLFFIRAPMAGMMDVVQKLGIRSVPALFIADATEKKGFATRPEQFLYKPGKENEYSEHEMSRFIYERAHVRIAGFWPGVQFEFLFVGLALAAVTIPLGYAILFHWRNKWTWFTVVMMMFFANQAGLVGNVVHNNPWYKLNPYTGETAWAMSGLMRQYRFEGIFGGSMVIVGGMALTAISVLVPRVKNAFVAQCLFLFFLFVAVMAVSQYTQLYCTFKNPSYPFRYYVEVPWANLRHWGLVTLHDFKRLLSG